MPLSFIDLSLPMCGSAMLRRAVEDQGGTWVHHDDGKLAEDIVFSKAAGRAPLTPWPDATGVSGLWSDHTQHLPAIHAYREVEYLADQFPDAIFLLTHRDRAEWITLRTLQDDGRALDLAAWHAEIPRQDVAAHWLDEMEAHLEACSAIFRGSDRFVLFDMDRDPPEKLGQRLVFGNAPVEVDPARAETATLSAIKAVLAELESPDILPPPPVFDVDFVDDVARHCHDISGEEGKPSYLAKDTLGYTTSGIVDKDGAPLPMLEQDSPSRIVCDPAARRYQRGHAALIEMIDHGAKPSFWIDMMDARWLGSPGRRHAPARTVVQCRRADVANLTLWPLPGYHTIAPSGAPGGYPIDPLPFTDKIDRVCWLGNITGRMHPDLTPDGRERRNVYNIRDQIAGAQGAELPWDDIIADLMCVPRYRAVHALKDDPDFEIGLVARPKWRAAMRTKPFDGMIHHTVQPIWFYQFKYILSLQGNDTGSNFLPAVASGSLVFKEEDGWELFYTGVFKPWVHYIPISTGATDVKEKLDWARSHQAKCARMVAAARDVYAKLADPVHRREYLGAIADGLNAGQ
ncbi:MAG: glycosyl transferase family 90 [Pseudomonadota bacterium]